MNTSQQLIGRQIGNYRITRFLARGGMADVYIAQDIDLQREVILKIMLPALANDEEFVARFRREARITAQLNHPNIVQVYRTDFTETGQPYLVMQYIRGGSLQDKMTELAAQGQLLATVTILTIMRQVASALEAAHQAGVVHRDMKPSNILLHPDGTPVVSDLGIAAVQSASRITRTGELMGTPHYMSPEQARGQPLDGRSDIYSLGIILHELFAGDTPFKGDSPLAVLHQHLYEPPPPLPQIRGDLAPITYQLVEKCLQKEPNGRFQSAAELVTAIDQALLAEGDTHRNPRMAPPASGGFLPPTSRGLPPTLAGGKKSIPKWVYAAGTAVFLLLLVFLGWQLLSTDDDTPAPTSTIAIADRITDSQPTATTAPTSTFAPTSTPVPATSTIQPTDTPLPTETAVPRRDLIVFQSNRDGDFEIYIMAANGQNQVQLTTNTSDDNYPAVSSTDQILFESDRDGNWEIYAMNLDGSDQRRLTNDPATDRLPTWSPDGQQIAFASNRDGDYEIYVMNADGSNVRQITFNEEREGRVSWSTSDRLVYNVGDEGSLSMELFAINVDGSNLAQLTSNNVNDWSPEWSPNGRFIVYLSLIGTDPGIFLMNADGTSPRMVYNTPLYEWGVHWSADSDKILFTQENDGVSSIYVMNADGSQVRLIAERGSYPSWVR